jgi:hypothetical protein
MKIIKFDQNRKTKINIELLFDVCKEKYRKHGNDYDKFPYTLKKLPLKNNIKEFPIQLWVTDCKELAVMEANIGNYPWALIVNGRGEDDWYVYCVPTTATETSADLNDIEVHFRFERFVEEECRKFARELAEVYASDNPQEEPPPAFMLIWSPGFNKDSTSEILLDDERLDDGFMEVISPGCISPELISRFAFYED